MPEVHFDIEWPDSEVTTHYSPSTVVIEYFQAGRSLSIAELRTESAEALGRAAERVRLKYGFVCTSAADSLRDISKRAGQYQPDDRVTIRNVT